MDFASALEIVCGFGAVGGFISDVSARTFTWPKWAADNLDFGFLTNILIGTFAAGVSQVDFLKRAFDASPDPKDVVIAAAAAALVGFSGVKWLKANSEVKDAESDKASLKASVVQAALKQPSPESAEKVLSAQSPEDIAGIVKAMA